MPLSLPSSPANRLIQQVFELRHLLRLSFVQSQLLLECLLLGAQPGKTKVTLIIVRADNLAVGTVSRLHPATGSRTKRAPT